MLSLLVSSLLAIQAAPLGDGAYIEKVACMASLTAAENLGTTEEKDKVRGPLIELQQHIDDVDFAERRDRAIRTEMFDGMYESQVRIDGWRFNIPRCVDLVEHWVADYAE